MLTVHLGDEVLSEGEQSEVELFLLFTGSSQRHLTSTLRVDHTTLQAVCPGQFGLRSVMPLSTVFKSVQKSSRVSVAVMKQW